MTQNQGENHTDLIVADFQLLHFPENYKVFKHHSLSNDFFFTHGWLNDGIHL